MPATKGFTRNKHLERETDTMSENGIEMHETIDAAPKRRVSVTFERKLGYDNYGNAVARAWIEGEVPWDSTVEQASMACGDLFAAAAAAVFDQLGIEYTMGEDGVIRETKTPTVSVGAATAALAANLGATEVDGPESGPLPGIRVMNPKDQQGPLPYWLVSECERLGITAVWDQRKTATGNQPKFKEAVARGSQGHGKDGQPKGFWEPKS